MKTVTMTFKNVDGDIIEKEIEERLVSIYLLRGWVIKSKETKKQERFYEQPKRLEK